MRVDFVIGGTQKGGTSALDSFLRQHPEICMPTTRKELHFFDREEENRDYKKYHANFKPKPQHRVIGEASPIYMYWETAPDRIWKYNPKMKWILALRNPVERAFSAWNMETKRGKEKLPFAEAIEKEPERCREALPLQHRVYSYVDRGFYAHSPAFVQHLRGAECSRSAQRRTAQRSQENTAPRFRISRRRFLIRPAGGERVRAGIRGQDRQSVTGRA